MSDITAGVVGVFVLGGLAGLAVTVGLWVLVLRLGLGPIRTELARIADAVHTQNEIALDDDLRPEARV